MESFVISVLTYLVSKNEVLALGAGAGVYFLRQQQLCSTASPAQKVIYHSPARFAPHRNSRHHWRRH